MYVDSFSGWYRTNSITDVLSVRALPSTIDLDDELEAGDMPSSIYAHDQVVTQQITLRISEVSCFPFPRIYRRLRL